MNKSAHDRKKKLRLPAWTPSWLRLLLRISSRITLICTILFLIAATFYYYLASQYDLDKVSKIISPNLILSSDNTELATLGSQSSEPSNYDEFPTHLIDALLAREDTRFRDHIGIDVIGLARATLKNIKEMSYKEGASTISMQLTKNTYDNKSKSIHRKLLEIAITLRLESRYDKNEILTHYLNRIYFGSGCHGIKEAANTYFNVSTNKLTLGQSALIVGIIRGPHIFSPFNNLKAATEQRDQVLTRMHSTGKITEQQRDNAKNAPLYLAKKSTQISTSSYAISSIRRHQQQIINTSEISEGGLNITSTIDKKLNDTIKVDVKNITSPLNIESKNPLQIATIILENKTGAVRAISGGSDYIKYPYNRALDSKQELGSAFTPFIYLAALDRGKIPLKNQPIVTGKQIGAKDLLGYSTRFGITHKPSAKAADLYRGSIYASPLQLATAYAIIQNKGLRTDSYFVEKITTNKDLELFTQDLNKDQNQKATVSSGAAINCLKMLTTGSSVRTKNIIQKITYAYKHAWIITSTPTHTAVIWIGHDSPSAIPNREQLTKTLQTKINTWLALL